MAVARRYTIVPGIPRPRPETELVLIHGELPTVEEREKHEHGWKGCLDQLANYISKRSAA